MDFERLFLGLPAAYLVMTRDLVIVEANEAYLELLGRTREELVGRYVFDAFPPPADALDEHGRNPVQVSFELVRDTGRPDVLPLQKYDVADHAAGRRVERYWSVVSAPLLGEDGTTSLVLQRVEDVTDYVRERANRRTDLMGDEEWERRVLAVEADLYVRLQQLGAARAAEAEVGAALRASEQRARAVLDTAVDGILTIDGTGRVESMNAAAERMFGWRAADVVGRNVSMLMPEPYRSEHDRYLERYHRTGERRIIGIGREVLGQRRDGSAFPLELAVSEVGGDSGLFTGVVRDISERKELEAQLARQALHDPLTGLANRSLLLDRLEHALARLPRHAGALALMFLDLDRFKLVNDSLGHDAGDELLIQTAERLRAVVRCEDLVARLGGDEFVVLCEDLPDPGDAEAVAARIVAALNAPVHVRGRDIRAPASVGVVTDVGERTASELLRDADAAMYQAKEQGRGRYALLDDLARRRAVERMQLADDLHQALESSQLRACYQPVVDLSTGQVVAAEALVRWHHPTRGVLLPASFLTIADEVGLLPELDEWMISTACADAAAWGRTLRRDIGVSVNVSASSLTDHDLLQRVAGVVQGAGLAPGQLTLEVTEGALMQAAGSTVTALEHLRQLDVRLAVDGFGTGFSSLRYLQKLPVRTLKVDRSFVGTLDAAADEVSGSSAVVRAIVSLAAGLDVDTVAEGIETPGQLAAVRELGCHIGQGYLLARPAPASDLLRAAQDGATLLPSAGPAPRSSRSSKARRRRRADVAQR